MPFKDVPNQDRVKKILKGAIMNKRVANAYLFSTFNNKLANDMAKTFAKALNCEKGGSDSCEKCLSCKKILKGVHPDIMVIAKEGENIKIDGIRELRAFVRFGPTEGRFKTVIVEEADKMNVQAANSFLKTLEEPLESVVFILVTSREDAIPKTIISRCQKIIFGYSEDKDLADNGDYDLSLNKLVSIGEMDVVETIAFSNELVRQGEDLDNILNKLLWIYRKEIVGPKKNKDADIQRIRAVLAALKAIKKNSNKRLALDNMLLKLKEV